MTGGDNVFVTAAAFQITAPSFHSRAADWDALLLTKALLTDWTPLFTCSVSLVSPGGSEGDISELAYGWSGFDSVFIWSWYLHCVNLCPNLVIFNYLCMQVSFIYVNCSVKTSYYPVVTTSVYFSYATFLYKMVHFKIVCTSPVPIHANKMNVYCNQSLHETIKCVAVAH